MTAQDYTRTGSYYAAIMENAADFAGKVVMDVGAGSGILSLFSAQVGKGGGRGAAPPLPVGRLHGVRPPAPLDLRQSGAEVSGRVLRTRGLRGAPAAFRPGPEARASVAARA